MTEELLAERETTHGDFNRTAFLIQLLKDCMKEGQNWKALSNVQKESLEMIANKVGRILTGDPDFADHWDDISGYALLAARTLK